MNQELYLKRFKEILAEMYTLTAAKSSDYSGHNSDDAFKNFKLVEKLGVATVEQGFIVRMSDKMQRLANLLKQDNHVSDEKITDTALDLGVYSILLKIYLETK